MDNKERCLNIAEKLLADYPPILEAFRHVFLVQEPSSSFPSTFIWQVPLPVEENSILNRSEIDFCFRILSTHIQMHVWYHYSYELTSRFIIHDYAPILGG